MPKIEGATVAHHFAGILRRLEKSRNELAHAYLFGTGNFDDAVDRATTCDIGHRIGHIIGENGLK